MSKSKKKARVVDPMARLIWQAEKIVKSAKLPRGARLVVAVTDGELIGVSSNTTPPDVEAILRSALLGGVPRVWKVIEAAGEEVSSRPLLGGRS